MGKLYVDVVGVSRSLGVSMGWEEMGSLQDIARYKQSIQKRSEVQARHLCD